MPYTLYKYIRLLYELTHSYVLCTITPRHCEDNGPVEIHQEWSKTTKNVQTFCDQGCDPMSTKRDRKKIIAPISGSNDLDMDHGVVQSGSRASKTIANSLSECAHMQTMPVNTLVCSTKTIGSLWLQKYHVRKILFM